MIIDIELICTQTRSSEVEIRNPFVMLWTLQNYCCLLANFILELLLHLILVWLHMAAIEIQSLRLEPSTLLVNCSVFLESLFLWGEFLLLFKIVANLLIGFFNLLAQKFSCRIRVLFQSSTVGTRAILLIMTSMLLHYPWWSTVRIILTLGQGRESCGVVVEEDGSCHSRVRGLLSLLMWTVSSLLIACTQQHLSLVAAPHWWRRPKQLLLLLERVQLSLRHNARHYRLLLLFSSRMYANALQYLRWTPIHNWSNLASQWMA